MAAPASKTIKDLNGTWVLNKKLSDSADPGLVIQGIGFLIRNIIRVAPVTIEVKQYEAPGSSPATDPSDVVHIDIVQSAPGTSPSTELRSLDNVARDHSDWLFGDVKNQVRWTAPEEIDDDYLKSGWLSEEGGKFLIYSQETSVGKGWTATQVWGFQTVEGERRHCRNIVIQKEAKRVEFRFVYDWQEPN
ncbi:uncharacterized protein N7473_000567 [Penicillium subrubescens]|uniref:LCCL domain-containing protein n=1 Tax=Penicillium subrubescens TaxID=1316194 RepID=A0A1Q5U7V1_9EURO|nr:uncharacterized protein N7473_000567 [Penicillium subrubescens]KAJ5911264.1 hypothetical protein N7473_000567 [Penicillium subrubescens]OKP08570.1 hypothetical protein PENSUB_5557 [Penicillium subrubescens]